MGFFKSKVEMDSDQIFEHNNLVLTKLSKWIKKSVCKIGTYFLKLVHFYNDTGQASLHLSYLRNKEKQEVDFILLNKKKPILTIEVKLSDYNLDKTFLKFQKSLKIPHIQIIQPEGVLRKFKELDACVVSFDRFFKKLPWG